MTVIFDGRAFSKEKEIELTEKVRKLYKQGIIPKLVSILIGNDPASNLYVSLKKKAAERIKAKVKIKRFDDFVDVEEIINLIKKLNKDDLVHGIMVQLPLPNKFSKKDRNKIISTIAKEKDVDGLGDKSIFITPTLKAVLNVLKLSVMEQQESNEKLKLHQGSFKKVVIVGYRGFEGRKIYKSLKEMNYDVFGTDRKTNDLKLKITDADIVISATGSQGIIKKNMIKNGAVLIDVGSPHGDIDKDAYQKASFVSPVPGGIGPMTISCLLENLVDAAK